MSDKLHREDAADGVTVLSLNRAPVNALNPQYLKEIEEALADINGDDSVRALVLTSGLKVLSAGMDLKEAIAFSDSDQTAVVDGLNDTYTRLYSLSKPVITAANGAAIAGGLFFILAADYTVASERGKFGLTEARVGVNFPVAPLEIARAALGPAALRQIMLGGNLIGAAAAREMGMVDEVTSPDEVMPRALAVARDYAAIPPKTYASIKAQNARKGTDNNQHGPGGWFRPNPQRLVQRGNPRCDDGHA
ncbi:MAG: enoyl-CoA hydratase/isomerase family protein [Rhodospirillaceae bacterium]|nr:enoyl-CoA hydratase/isomerase family protein [Rhodospirillaceae bacterium]